MPQNVSNEKSTLVQVMAWYRQATSHYLSHCWLKSMMLYGITRPQWVKLRCILCQAAMHCELMWPLEIPTAFSEAIDSSLHSPNARQFAWHEGCARRLWDSLTNSDITNHRGCQIRHVRYKYQRPRDVRENSGSVHNEDISTQYITQNWISIQWRRIFSINHRPAIGITSVTSFLYVDFLSCCKQLCKHIYYLISPHQHWGSNIDDHMNLKQKSIFFKEMKTFECRIARVFTMHILWLSL